MQARRAGRAWCWCGAPRGARWSALALAFLAGQVGCAGDGPASSNPDSDFGRIQSEVFNENCLSAGCHNLADQSGDMILAAGFSFDQIVRVEPFNEVAREEGLLRVAPFLPAQSFLLIKLTGPGPGQGSRMPLGMPPLPESDIELIRSWILAGAPPGDDTPLPTATPAPPTATPTPTGTETATRPTSTPTTPPPAS